MPNAFCNFQKNVYNFFLTLTAVFSGNFEDTDFYIGPLEAQFYVEYENRKSLRDTSTVLEIFANKRNPVFRQKGVLYIGQWGLMG